MSTFCRECESSEAFVCLATLEAEAEVDENGNFCNWISLDGALERPSFGKITHCFDCGSTNIGDYPKHVIEYYLDNEWNAYENEVSEDPVDDGFTFGVRFGTYLTDQSRIATDIEWFATEEDKIAFINKLKNEKFLALEWVISLKDDC